MFWKYVNLISIVVLFFVFFSCTKSEYKRLEERELSKGIRKDSIILGLELGDTKKNFRDKCMTLNQEQILSQGPRGAVLYQLTDSLYHKSPTKISVLIFSFFDDNEVLTNFDLEFSYDAWAPWNQQFQSDSLEFKLKKVLMDWYGGNEFVYANIGEEKKVPVKVDGNRRLMLKVKDEKSVVIMAQDMLHPKYQRKK